jgi:serine/threonine protein kinase
MILLSETRSEEGKLETLDFQNPAVETSMETSMESSVPESDSAHRVEDPSKTAITSSEEPFAQTIGRFRLVRKLGRGGFGEVWEALDSHLGRKVAIKLPIFPLSDQKRSRRFLTEAQAAARLAHPNIVAVYDAGVIESQHYLAIEYVNGKSLDALVSESPLSPSDSAQLVTRLAQALGYAHDHSIVHRDIKPQNIVLDQDGTPKIVDFGLAKLLEQGTGQTIDGTVMGTPAYMAPEQAKGEVNRIGPHTDQYSLGAVLYWLIARRTPFAGPRIAIITQVISSEPEKPSLVNAEIDPRLEAICLKAMSKLPQDRYRSCHEFAQDLQRYCDNEDTLAKPPSWRKRLSRVVLQNPRESMVGCVALGLFGIVLTTSVFGYQRASKLAAEANQARQKATIELAKQKALEADLARQLVEVERAKQSAIQAKEKSEQKRNELTAASEGLQTIASSNETLGATKDEQLGQLTKAKEQQTVIARESNRIEISTNPEAALLRVQNAVLEKRWNEATETLQLIPASHRLLPWKLLAHFTVNREIKLHFEPKAKRLAIPISLFRWDSKNELLRLGTGNWDAKNELRLESSKGKFEVLDGDSMETLEYVANRSIRPDGEFLYDRKTRQITGIELSVGNSFSPSHKKFESVNRFGYLLQDSGTNEIICVGLETENNRQKNSKLCIAKLVDREWDVVWSKPLKGRTWESTHIRSEGSTHYFKLTRPKSTLPEISVVAKVDLSSINAPEVVFNEIDEKASGTIKDKSDAYWEDLLFETVKRKGTGTVLDWSLNVSLIEFEPVLSVPVTGVLMRSVKEPESPRFAFDRNDRIFFAFGVDLAVCHLKFMELLHE